MVIDGQGSRVADLTETWEGAVGVPDDWCEVASFYRADRQRVECLGKQLWNRDERQPVGLGMFYFLLTQAMFPAEGNEGKVMGLAPHGKATALRLPPRWVSTYARGQCSLQVRQIGHRCLRRGPMRL